MNTETHAHIFSLLVESAHYPHILTSELPLQCTPGVGNLRDIRKHLSQGMSEIFGPMTGSVNTVCDDVIALGRNDCHR